MVTGQVSVVDVEETEEVSKQEIEGASEEIEGVSEESEAEVGTEEVFVADVEEIEVVSKEEIEVVSEEAEAVSETIVAVLAAIDQGAVVDSVGAAEEIVVADFGVEALVVGAGVEAQWLPMVQTEVECQAERT